MKKEYEGERKLEVHETPNYNTVILSGDKAKKADKEEERTTGVLLELLTHPSNKLIKEEVLVELKNDKGKKLLIEALKDYRKTEHYNTLLTACWEAYLDFSDELPFFIELAVGSDYISNLEILTIIEDMHGLFKEGDLTNAITALKNVTSKKVGDKLELYKDMLKALERHVA